MSADQRRGSQVRLADLLRCFELSSALGPARPGRASRETQHGTVQMLLSPRHVDRGWHAPEGNLDDVHGLRSADGSGEKGFWFSGRRVDRTIGTQLGCRSARYGERLNGAGAPAETGLDDPCAHRLEQLLGPHACARTSEALNGHHPSPALHGLAGRHPFGDRIPIARQLMTDCEARHWRLGQIFGRGLGSIRSNGGCCDHGNGGRSANGS